MPTLAREYINAAAIAIAATMTAGDAQAVVRQRALFTNPVGICQAALPAFEGQIRKRPLAIQNEGTSNAFVTCAFTSQAEATSVVMYFAGFDNLAHDVTCTGVTGFNRGLNQFVTKTVTLPASDSSSLAWAPADFAGGSSTFPDARFSVSCNLAPGVGINDAGIAFNEDVGA